MVHSQYSLCTSLVVRHVSAYFNGNYLSPNGALHSCKGNNELTCAKCTAIYRSLKNEIWLNTGTILSIILVKNLIKNFRLISKMFFFKTSTITKNIGFNLGRSNRACCWMSPFRPYNSLFKRHHYVIVDFVVRIYSHTRKSCRGKLDAHILIVVII